MASTVQLGRLAKTGYELGLAPRQFVGLVVLGHVPEPFSRHSHDIVDTRLVAVMLTARNIIGPDGQVVREAFRRVPA